MDITNTCAVVHVMLLRDQIFRKRNILSEDQIYSRFSNYNIIVISKLAKFY